jgi:hypothetical protein
VVSTSRFLLRRVHSLWSRHDATRDLESPSALGVTILVVIRVLKLDPSHDPRQGRADRGYRGMLRVTIGITAGSAPRAALANRSNRALLSPPAQLRARRPRLRPCDRSHASARAIVRREVLFRSAIPRSGARAAPRRAALACSSGAAAAQSRLGYWSKAGAWEQTIIS